MRFGRIGWLVGAIWIALAAFVTSSGPANAQGSGWSIPQQIPGLDERIEPPFLVADRDRTVHAFYSVPAAGGYDVVYNKWSLASGWTRPVDIVLVPLNQDVRIGGAYLDPVGQMHLIVSGSSPPLADIYYM